MAIISFIISLAAATLLLLFAVRLVQTGIDRAFGSSFRRLLSRNQSPPNAAFVGANLAILMQSSAAVALLVSEFSATGAISTSAGIATVLGADLGSAIVVKLLSLRIDWIMPVFLAAGGVLFLKTRSNGTRQMGRVLLGIGLILLSLDLLREAVEPIHQSDFVPAVASYLEKDLITAFLIGAALAFVMHSSVAVILMCTTLVAIQTIPFLAGVGLLLGANLGSAFIPMWLARGKGNEAFRILVANLLLRGSMAIVALMLVQTPIATEFLVSHQSASNLLIAHLLFNAILLLFIPFSGLIAKAMRFVIADTVEASDSIAMRGSISILDNAVLSDPQQAANNLRREVLRMGGLVEEQIKPVMQLYKEEGLSSIEAHGKRDIAVNQILSGIRSFVIDLNQSETDQATREQIGALTEYAINLEAAADVVAKRLVPLASKRYKQQTQFSSEGLQELVRIHDHVMVNIGLAMNVLVSEDIDTARRLISEKSKVTKRERSSRKQHLRRIQSGTEASIDSSNLHLETLTALKDINSQICSISYPILYRAGLLLDSRLISVNEQEDV